MYDTLNKKEIILPLMQYSRGKLASVRMSPRCPINTPVMTDYLINPYALLTKPKVKITGCWPSPFLRFFDHDDVEVHKKTEKENEANIKPCLVKKDLSYIKEISLY